MVVAVFGETFDGMGASPGKVGLRLARTSVNHGRPCTRQGITYRGFDPLRRVSCAGLPKVRTFPGGPEALRSTLADTARAAEAAGCSTFTLMDHWFQMEGYGGAHDPMLEGYTGLGYLAAVTQRMTLGVMVTGVTYRHPGLLAKI